MLIELRQRIKALLPSEVVADARPWIPALRTHMVAHIVRFVAKEVVSDERELSLENFVQYLNTWSGVQKYEKAKKLERGAAIEEAIRKPFLEVLKRENQNWNDGLLLRNELRKLAPSEFAMQGRTLFVGVIIVNC